MGASATATLADEYANNRTAESRKPAGLRGGKTNVIPTVSNPKPNGSSAPAPSSRSGDDSRVCFLCKRTGHIRSRCPQLQKGQPLPQRSAPVLFVGGGGGGSLDNMQPVTVGQAVAMGLRDTGAERTLVRPELVSPQDLVPGKTLAVSGIGGVEPALPVAKVFLDWGAGHGVREVGVSASIPTSVLLGTDLGRLVSQYVATEPPGSTPVKDVINVDNIPVVGGGGMNDMTCTFSTGGKGMEGNVIDDVIVCAQQTGGNLLSSGGLSERTNGGPVAAEGGKAIVVGGTRGRVVLPGEATGPGSSLGKGARTHDSQSELETRSEAEGKWALPVVTATIAAVTRSGNAGAQGVPRETDSFPSSDPVAARSDGGQDAGLGELTEDVVVSTSLATSSQEFQAALESDASLKDLKEQAAQPSSDSDLERVVWDQGRLYRETIQQGSPEAWTRDRQVVVPYPFRAELLRIAHEIPMAGHLGVTKTKARLVQHFYWPKMGADVTAYCRSCVTCQRVGKSGRRPKAPLIPLPIIDEPFRRVAVDLIGPLSIPSSSGKRFILTVVDYATRYPEAVALSSIRADKVATALLEIFSRVGFPQEMLTDRGTQFMSQLMESLCKQTQVQHLVTSPYHRRPMACAHGSIAP